MGGMLDHRVYRAAFLPALVATFVLAFSLADVPRAKTTRLAPLAFDGSRAFVVMNDLAERFPDRRPGSTGDAALADLVVDRIERTGFAAAERIERSSESAATIDGESDLETVVATREGLSDHKLVVIAHRDAARSGAPAELSGTAVLLELARLFADRDLAKTVVLASVSGGSGGHEGARAVAESVRGPVDAVLVLGDLATGTLRRPMVVPWANGTGPAPLALERTVQAALRAEVDADPGATGPVAQVIRRALPLTLSAQGPVNAEGLPAVLVSSSSERGPSPAAEPLPGRFDAFGRATLRTLYAALDARGDDPFPASDGVVALKRVVPTWSIRLLVLMLLLPALVTAFDGFFRARRRGAPMGRWAAWAAAFALPVLAAWLWARVLGLLGAVPVLPAPAREAILEPTGAGWAALASTALVAAVAGWLVRRRGPRGPQLAAGGPAAASGLMLSALVLVVWLLNPYAAAVLLPAAHAWLLASAPDRRPRRGVALAAVGAGLVLPLLVVVYYADAWRLALVDVVWVPWNLIAGGALGIGAAAALSLFFAALCATVAIVRVRGALSDAEPPADDRLVTRGPRSYAGPGSLGGTESALRR